MNFSGDTFPVLLKQLFEQRVDATKLSIASSASKEYFQSAGKPEVSNGIIIYNIDQDRFSYDDLDENKPSLPAYAFACYSGMKFFLDSASRLYSKDNLTQDALIDELAWNKNSRYC